MPVQVLSLKKAKEQGAIWAVGGDNIKYGVSKLMHKQNYGGDDETTTRQRLYF